MQNYARTNQSTATIFSYLWSILTFNVKKIAYNVKIEHKTDNFAQKFRVFAS